MNYFLMLIIILLCGGGYYEYNQLQQKSTGDQQQISDLSAKVDTLQAENKKLEDAQAQLTKNADDATAQVTDLTKQLQDAQTALTAAKAEGLKTKAAPPSATTAAGSSSPVTPTSNNLGTIATLDGKSYQNCQLLKVEADGIVINDTDGIIKLAFGLLPPPLQKRFAYDPHGPPTLTADQVDFLEAQRKTNQGASN